MITVNGKTYTKVSMWCTTPEDALKFARLANPLMLGGWSISDHEVSTFFRRHKSGREPIGLFTEDDADLTYLKDRSYNAYRDYLTFNEIWELKATGRIYINGEVV